MRRAAIIRACVVLTALASLELGVRLGAIPRTVVIAPTEMLAALYGLAADGRLVKLAQGTLATVAAAIAVSLLLGSLLGLALHVSPRLRRALDPLLASYYAVPIFVFYPLLIVLFGMGAAPLVGLGAMFGVIIIALSLVQGLDRLPLAIDKTARLERMGFVETTWRIRIPYVLPYMMHGLKLAVAYAFVGVIGGEFILAPSGLGHAIAFAYNDFDNPTMYALMLFVVLLVTAVNLGLHGFEKRLRRRRGLS